MQVTVFYAWQSDTPEHLNRKLIWKAAEAACERITADPGNDWEVKLDSDTKGVLGMCDIPREILKKIRNCDIFIADLTLMGTGHDSDKKLPNPNVTFELGYAAGRHTFRPMIGVVNEGFGEIEGQIFDIKRRSALKYTAKPTATPERIEKVTNQLSEKLEGIVRETIENWVVDRRADRETSLRSKYEEKHAEFAKLVAAGHFYELTTLPAVVHSIKFKWPRGVNFDTVIEALRQQANRPIHSPGAAGWTEKLSTGEIREEAVFRRAAINDVTSANYQAASTGHIPDSKFLMVDTLQRNLAIRVGKDIEFLEGLGIEGPWMVGLSLVGAKGFKLLDHGGSEAPRLVDTNELNFPMVKVSSMDQLAKLADGPGPFTRSLNWMAQTVGWRKSTAIQPDGYWRIRSGAKILDSPQH